MGSFQRNRAGMACVSLERYYVSPATKVLGIFASEVAPCFPAEDTRAVQKRAMHDPE